MTLRAQLRPTYARLRRLAFEAWAPLNGGGISVHLAPDWRVRVAPAGYEDLLYWARYEAPTLACLRRMLQPGMRILDVGAHHGVFSVCCCPQGAMPARIVAVEPSPSALPLLRANAAAQRGVPWTIIPAAAGAAPGALTLFPGFIHMLVADPTLHHVPPGPPVEVAVRTLDAICASENLRPDLIKIDVEGYEAEALAGARATLAQRPLLLLEWHCAMLRQRGLDPLAALAPLAESGYTFEPYEHPGLGPLTAPALARLPPRDIYRLCCRAPAGSTRRAAGRAEFDQLSQRLPLLSPR